VVVRRFSEPDEMVEVGRVRSEILSLGGATLAHDTHQPGWRWSVDVKPRVGTEWCETRHLGYTQAGNAHIAFRDGSGFDVGPGDVHDIPPGHDAWVVGNEPWVVIGWMGASTWLSSAQTLRERILVTILFTDIVDSTSRVATMGDRAWAELIAGHDLRMTDLIGHHGGQIGKLTGDGVMAVFDGAGRAIRCALACHLAASEIGVTLRAAVHTGEIESAGDEWHGLAIHEASRLVALAAPGETLISDVTKQLSRDQDLALQDRGLITLKGLDSPLHVHSVSGSP
jgi:class 3 adenylate cyclase